MLTMSLVVIFHSLFEVELKIFEFFYTLTIEEIDEIMVKMKREGKGRKKRDRWEGK